MSFKSFLKKVNDIIWGTDDVEVATAPAAYVPPVDEFHGPDRVMAEALGLVPKKKPVLCRENVSIIRIRWLTSKKPAVFTAGFFYYNANI